MIQTSEGAVKHAGFGNIASIVRRLAEEAPVPVALHMDHGRADATVTLDHFGASAPGNVVLEKLGFTAAAVASKARELLP